MYSAAIASLKIVYYLAVLSISILLLCCSAVGNIEEEVVVVEVW